MFKQATKALAVAGAAITLTHAPAQAVVVDPGSSVANSPSDAVLARWGGSASGVVISSEHIITTRHQLGGVGTTVQVDGVNYTVAEVTVIQDLDTPANSLDLRVARLETQGGQAPNFTEFVPIYNNTDEVGKTLVIGGYGEGRGASLGVNVGYQWDGIDGTLRWGANKADGALADQQFTSYTNDTLTATSDLSSDQDAVNGEASVARDDSGGGWFYNDAGTWKLVALSQGVENADEALYGEVLSGVRLSSYATQINTVIPEPGTAALLVVGGACLATRRRRSV